MVHGLFAFLFNMSWLNRIVIPWSNISWNERPIWLSLCWGWGTFMHKKTNDLHTDHTILVRPYHGHIVVAINYLYQLLLAIYWRSFVLFVFRGVCEIDCQHRTQIPYYVDAKSSVHWRFDRITFCMAPPLFHSFLLKGISYWGKLDTSLFRIKWTSGGAIRKLFRSIDYCLKIIAKQTSYS